MAREDLFQTLIAAFPDTPLPERPVTGHRCGECDEVDAILGGRTWTAIASAFPDYCHDVFPLLTPAAKAYYLPAYMLAAVGPKCGMQGTSLEGALAPGGGLPRVGFTAAQRAAVLRWAKAYWDLVDRADPPESFTEYWRDELPV